MFKKICIELNAANPQIPFEACCPYSGSAASFTILNVPRPLGKRTVSAVYVGLTDVAGVTRSFAATRVGSAWGATVPASAVGESGIVTGGVCVWASGTDDNGAAVDCWILGTGDLRVLNRDGTVSPDVIRHNVHGYAEKPTAPKNFDLAPASASEGAPFELFFDGAWRPIGLTSVDVYNKKEVDVIVAAKVGSFEPVGGVTPTVKNGVANLTGLFGESNTLLAATIDARLTYPLYAVPSTGVLKDRALNTTSLASVTVPDDFTDLLIRASVASSLPVEMPKAIATKYGDTFPGESGEYLITITKTGAAEAYVRTIKLEEVANA